MKSIYCPSRNKVTLNLPSEGTYAKTNQNPKVTDRVYCDVSRNVVWRVRLMSIWDIFVSIKTKLELSVFTILSLYLPRFNV